MSFSTFGPAASFRTCPALLLFAATLVACCDDSSGVTILADDGRRLHDDNGDGVFESFGSATFPQLWATRYPDGPNVNEVQFALEFTLPPTPGGQSILSATLRLDEDFDTATFTPEVDLYGYAGDGAVTLADANTGSLLISSINDGVQNSYNSFDVTTFVQSISLLATPIAGFRVEATTLAISSSAQYRIEPPNSLSGGPPELVLVFGVVPEPASCALALLGVSFVGRRRR